MELGVCSVLCADIRAIRGIITVCYSISLSLSLSRFLAIFIQSFVTAFVDVISVPFAECIFASKPNVFRRHTG